MSCNAFITKSYLACTFNIFLEVYNAASVHEIIKGASIIRVLPITYKVHTRYAFYYAAHTPSSSAGPWGRARLLIP